MKKITPQTMKAIVDLWCCDKELAPEGQFYCLENNIWVACDNSTGDCWIEEFETENGVIGWLEDDNVCDANNYSLGEEV